MKEIRYLSLFSGIGGFEVGLQNSKHNFINCAYSEVDKYAISIYTRHFPNHRNLGDATKIKTEDLPEFDFLVGGFPCQAFSHAGLRRGFDDTRGTLFFEIARILKDKRPKCFLLENVKGLLSHNKGETFQTILKVLSDIGYTVKWSVLNSKDFGVPQNRERVFIEGYSRNECSGEILSFRHPNAENIGKISNTYYGGRTGRVHYPDEHMNTLACSGHNGANSQLIVEHLSQKVYKRKYEVDIPKLQKLLRKHKKEQGLSNNDIANALEIPLTNVAHWFRTDKHFSIPSRDIWFDLKKLLKITDDSLDKSITEFDELDGNYDMHNRAYHENGIAPTITSTERKLICVNKGASQAQKVYDADGMSSTLSACGGGDGGKTGLYLVPDNRKINKVGNVYKNGGSNGDVYSSEGLCPTILTGTKGNMHKIIEEPSERKIKKVGNFSRTNHQGGNIYSDEGLSPTLVSNSIIKNGLHITESTHNERKINVVGNTSPSNHGSQKVFDTDGLSPTLTATDYKHPKRILEENIDKYFTDVDEKREIQKIGSTNGHQSGNVYDEKGISPSLCSTDYKSPVKVSSENKNNYRIRRLTPVECERLQAFPDNWTKWGKYGEIISDTQRYKCCGNAVTTSVITAIVNTMFDDFDDW